MMESVANLTTGSVGLGERGELAMRRGPWRRTILFLALFGCAAVLQLAPIPALAQEPPPTLKDLREAQAAGWLRNPYKASVVVEFYDTRAKQWVKVSLDGGQTVSFAGEEYRYYDRIRVRTTVGAELQEASIPLDPKKSYTLTTLPTSQDSAIWAFAEVPR